MKCEKSINVKVRDLKECLEGLPDDMDVVIPVHDEDDSNVINGYRHVRTIGILENGGGETALGIATSEHGANMDNLMKLNAGDTTCKKVLF